MRQDDVPTTVATMSQDDVPTTSAVATMSQDDSPSTPPHDSNPLPPETPTTASAVSKPSQTPVRPRPGADSLFGSLGRTELNQKIAKDSEGKNSRISTCFTLAYVTFLGKWAGPMKIDSFFEEFLPCPVKDTTGIDFTHVGTTTKGEQKFVRRDFTILAPHLTALLCRSVARHGSYRTGTILEKVGCGRSGYSSYQAYRHHYTRKV